MIFGRRNILASSKHGMVDLHMQGFTNAARKNHFIYIVRNVSVYAADFIAAGYPTKPFGVDIKSCKKGVFAGLFPMDLKYSHVPEKDHPAEQKKFDRAKEVNSNFEPVALVLDEKRINWLQSKELLVATPIDAGFHLEWEIASGVRREARAIKGDQGYAIQDEHGTPLMALGQKVTVGFQKIVLPLTADYDLFAVLTKKEVFDPGELDHTPLSTQSHLVEDFEKAKLDKYSGPKEDPRLGNVSQRMQKAIRSVNEAIGELDPLRVAAEFKMVHHNAENASPKATDLKNSLPLMLFLPLDQEHENEAVILIESKDTVTAIREMIVEAGFHWASHQRYRTEFPPFDPSQLSVLSDHPRGTRSRHEVKSEDEGTFIGLFAHLVKPEEKLVARDSATNNQWWAREFRKDQSQKKNWFIPKSPVTVSPITPISGLPSVTPSSGIRSDEKIVPTEETSPPSSLQASSITTTDATPPPRPRPRNLTVFEQKIEFTFTGTIAKSRSGRDEKLLNLHKDLMLIMKEIETKGQNEDRLTILHDKYNDLANKITRYNGKQSLTPEDYKMLTDFKTFIKKWATGQEITLQEQTDYEKPTSHRLVSWIAKNRQALGTRFGSSSATVKKIP